MLEGTPTRHKTGLSFEEIKKQVENYETIPFWKSWRGVSTYFIVLFLLVNLISVFRGKGDVTILLILAAVFLPLAYLFYKGHIWAMVLTAVLWTILEVITLVRTADVFQIVLWVIFAVTFYKAIVIEYYRKKYLKGEFNEEQLRQEPDQPHWLATLGATCTGLFSFVILAVAYGFMLYKNIIHVIPLITMVMYVIFIIVAIVFGRYTSTVIMKALKRKAIKIQQ